MRQIRPAMHIDVVEIDAVCAPPVALGSGTSCKPWRTFSKLASTATAQSVIEGARRFANFREDGRLRVFQADAAEFVTRPVRRSKGFRGWLGWGCRQCCLAKGMYANV